MRIRLVNIIKFLVAVLVLSITAVTSTSCITNKDNTYFQDDKKLPQYEKAEYEYYKIIPNDQLVIRLLTLNEEAAAIFNFAESTTGTTSYTYRVYDDGTIDIPFVNSIPVAGLTLREASKVIEEKLKDFVPDAMVKVALANDMFYMVGEGGKGSFNIYKEKLNIFQALALAGGPATNADKKRVRIVRPNPIGGRPIVKEFDLRTVSIINSEYYYVYPNDVIYLSSIKGNFWKIEDYSSALGTITTSIGFLVSVFNLGVTMGLY
jgi:polysaccharide export outer membrane protein